MGTYDRVFTEREPTAGSTNTAYVAALNRAFDRAASGIVGWMLGLV